MSASVVELHFEGELEHILIDEKPLCGVVLDEADARVVPEDQDPVAEASLNLCPKCADGWVNEPEPEREATARCRCDRFAEETVYECGAVVTASDARAVRNPDTSEGVIPVCRDCYEWIRERPHNSVETPYQQAPAWSTRLLG